MMDLLQLFYEEWHYRDKSLQLKKFLPGRYEQEDERLRRMRMLNAKTLEARQESAQKAKGWRRTVTQCDHSTKDLLLDNMKTLSSTPGTDDLLKSIFGLMGVYTEDDFRSWTFPELKALWIEVMTGKETESLSPTPPDMMVACQSPPPTPPDMMVACQSPPPAPPDIVVVCESPSPTLPAKNRKDIDFFFEDDKEDDPDYAAYEKFLVTAFKDKK